MTYFTFRVTGRFGARWYTAGNIDIIRQQTGNWSVPIHVIGGIGGDATKAETAGFVDAVRGRRAIGGSYYTFPITRPADWSRLERLRSIRRARPGRARARLPSLTDRERAPGVQPSPVGRVGQDQRPQRHVRPRGLQAGRHPASRLRDRGGRRRRRQVPAASPVPLRHRFALVVPPGGEGHRHRLLRAGHRARDRSGGRARHRRVLHPIGRVRAAQAPRWGFRRGVHVAGRALLAAEDPAVGRRRRALRQAGWVLLHHRGPPRSCGPTRTTSP